MRAIGIGSVCLLLIGLPTTSSFNHLNETQEKHIWDLFKLRNVHIEARTSKPGFIFGAISKFGKKLVELIEIGQRVYLTVPLANGWSRRFTVPIQRNESSKVHILVIIGQDSIIMAINCRLVLSESLRDISFVNFSAPRMVTGSPESLQLHIDSGDPLRRTCPNYSESSLKIETENIEGINEEIEPKNNIQSPHKAGSVPKNHAYQGSSENYNYKYCWYNGRLHVHNEFFWPQECVRCHCENGVITCQFQHPITCPLLTCPLHEQKTLPNQCCPACLTSDFCKSSPCHLHAECSNEKYGPKCKCKEGFFGNGTICYDIDECAFDAYVKEQLGGCSSGSVCVNEPGSFRCECLPGHQRLDDKICLDLLRV